MKKETIDYFDDGEKGEREVPDEVDEAEGGHGEQIQGPEVGLLLVALQLAQSVEDVQRRKRHHQHCQHQNGKQHVKVLQNKIILCYVK